MHWSLQLGFITLSKSVTKSKIFENTQISQFKIIDTNMKKMERFDEGLCTDVVDWIRVYRLTGASDLSMEV